MAVRSRDTASVRRICSSTSEHLIAALKRRDGQGHTLMHWAAKSGEVEMLELLASKLGLATSCCALCVAVAGLRDTWRACLVFWIKKMRAKSSTLDMLPNCHYCCCCYALYNLCRTHVAYAALIGVFAYGSTARSTLPLNI